MNRSPSKRSPAKPKSNLTVLVQTHVTTEQARMLEARLAHTGDSQSAYVRKLILKDLGIIKTEDTNA